MLYNYSSVNLIAKSIAQIRLLSLAIPLPAISNAVPWSTDVLIIGKLMLH